MMLLPRDFFGMSPKHFSFMMDGYREKRNDSYRQTRLLMFTMVRLMADPKTAPKSPEELWPLPGEQSTKQISDDEIRELFKRLGNGD